MIKVLARKPFDAGKGIVKKGDTIEIPEELLPHFLKNGKVSEISTKVEKVKAKVKEVKAKVEEVKEVIEVVKKKRKRKSKK
jgi:hypothetical protein